MADTDQHIAEANVESPLGSALPRHVFMFRMQDGRRVRWRFTLDAQLTILDERVDEGGSVSAIDPRDQHLLDRGYGFERRGGSVFITKVPPLEDLATRALVSATPCWFSGCQELRDEYQKELAALTADCPPCEHGTLIRKFTERAIALLTTKPIEPAPATAGN